MDYRTRYIKYKTKYLNLKSVPESIENRQEGGNLIASSNDMLEIGGYLSAINYDTVQTGGALNDLDMDVLQKLSSVVYNDHMKILNRVDSSVQTSADLNELDTKNDFDLHYHSKQEQYPYKYFEYEPANTNLNQLATVVMDHSRMTPDVNKYVDSLVDVAHEQGLFQEGGEKDLYKNELVTSLNKWQDKYRSFTSFYESMGFMESMHDLTKNECFNTETIEKNASILAGGVRETLGLDYGDDSSALETKLSNINQTIVDIERENASHIMMVDVLTKNVSGLRSKITDDIEDGAQYVEEHNRKTEELCDNVRVFTNKLYALDALYDSVSAYESAVTTNQVQNINGDLTSDLSEE